jgi:hypothetical protein
MVASTPGCQQLFSKELRAARGILAHGPKHEIYGHFDGQPVRRLLLEKTRCHLYYVVVEREDLVRIVAVWGAGLYGVNFA